MSELHVIDHPMIQHKLTLMRKEETSSKDFRELLDEVTRDLPLMDVEIQTPICKTTQKMIAGKALVIVPILRAGIGMVNGLHRLVPAAKVGHIGLYRDPETHKPVEYYCKLPQGIENRELIVVDPMLAAARLTQSRSLSSAAARTSSSCVWSPRRRASTHCRRRTRMSTSTRRRWMKSSTSTPISCPASATRVTASSVLSNKKNKKVSFPRGRALFSYHLRGKCYDFLKTREVVADCGKVRYNEKAVLGGELAVPCTRNPL